MIRSLSNVKFLQSAGSLNRVHLEFRRLHNERTTNTTTTISCPPPKKKKGKKKEKKISSN